MNKQYTSRLRRRQEMCGIECVSSCRSEISERVISFEICEIIVSVALLIVSYCYEQLLELL
jgi:hypothetical protein